MDETMKNNLCSHNTWKRILYMILFGFIYSVAEIVVFAVAVLQVISTLLKGEKNAPLLEFGAGLSEYLYQILQFFTFNSEIRPFPFTPWPDSKTVSDAQNDTGDVIDHAP